MGHEALHTKLLGSLLGRHSYDGCAAILPSLWPLFHQPQGTYLSLSTTQREEPKALHTKLLWQPMGLKKVINGKQVFSETYYPSSARHRETCKLTNSSHEQIWDLTL